MRVCFAEQPSGYHDLDSSRSLVIYDGFARYKKHIGPKQEFRKASPFFDIYIFLIPLFLTTSLSASLLYTTSFSENISVNVNEMVPNGKERIVRD